MNGMYILLGIVAVSIAYTVTELARLASKPPDKDTVMNVVAAGLIHAQKDDHTLLVDLSGHSLKMTYLGGDNADESQEGD